MTEQKTATNLKAKFEELTKPPPEPEKRRVGGKVGWDDNRDQGAKKITKGGMTVFGELPPKKRINDLP
jgi:hypothetical protein